MAEDSGKFLLRLDPALHRHLKGVAVKTGLSLNELCVRVLAAGCSERLLTTNGVAAAVTVAHEIHKNDLLGLVLYGSWIRQTATSGSDVDLLIVLRSHIAVSRRLYKNWDQRDLQIDHHAVQPTIVALPDPDSKPTGFWAEIATEGFLLYDRDLSVSNHLMRVRHAIAVGMLRRESIHGQGYWVHKTEVAS
jgi:predicted nucleotidyltransferase